MGSERSRLIIGVENDATGNFNDNIILYSCNGSGNVGVNTLNPLYNLDVSGTFNVSSTATFGGASTFTGAVQINNTLGVTGVTTITNTTTNNFTTSSGALIVSGGVGIFGNVNVGSRFFIGTSSDGIANSISDSVYSSPSLGMNIIGKGSPNLSPNRNIYMYDNVYISNLCQSVTFNATSDYRVKENIKYLNDNYSVDGLKPLIYDLIKPPISAINPTNTTYLKQTNIGFIAHELQEHFPYLVEGCKDKIDASGNPVYQSINYNGLIGVLVYEVQKLKKNVSDLSQKEQEQSQEIKEIKQENQDLKTELDFMKQQLIAIQQKLGMI